MEEDRSGRVRWQNSKLSAYLRESGEGKRKKPPPPVGRDARQGDPTPTGDAAIDWRISVWWKDDACFYKGIIEAYNSESGENPSTVCSSLQVTLGQELLWSQKTIESSLCGLVVQIFNRSKLRLLHPTRGVEGPLFPLHKQMGRITFKTSCKLDNDETLHVAASY